MANPEHLALLKQGEKAWNKWRQTNPNIEPNLEGANLEREILFGANLEGAADLRGVILEWADLRGALLAVAGSFLLGPVVLEPPPSAVLFGVSAPSKIQPWEEFTVRFVAYLQEFESQAYRILKGLSPRSKSYLGVGVHHAYRH